MGVGKKFKIKITLDRRCNFIISIFDWAQFLISCKIKQKKNHIDLFHYNFKVINWDIAACKKD